MKNLGNKGRFETTVFFLIIPFLSLPLIAQLLMKKDKLGAFFISILVGLLGFLYVPSYTNDKVRYLERYEIYGNLNFPDFLSFLARIGKPDFLFDWLLFLFSHLGIRAEFVFFILTFLCVYLVVISVNNLIDITEEKRQYSYLAIICLLLLSFSLPSLLSGLRFTFASCIFIFGSLNLILFKKKSGWIYLILATQTHFSLLYFLPAVLLIHFFDLNLRTLRIAFLISFLFFLIPTSIITQVFSFANFSESISSKTTVYTGGEDFVSQNFEENESSFLIFILRSLWYYVMACFLILFNSKLSFNKQSSILLKLLYCTIILTNFTYAFPTIFSRYTIVIKLLFFIYLSYLLVSHNRVPIKKVYFLMFILYLVAFLINVLVLRYNLQTSLFSMDNIFMHEILFKQITPNDYLN